MPRQPTGTRTIAVINGKGGSSKTPTTAMLAAVFARGKGRGRVLAWDNNETRGTLGWRTERQAHEANVRDLLLHADRLLREAGNSAPDISEFVHHQSADTYDVLQSNPAVLPSDERLTAEDVEVVHRLVTRRYRMVVMDSGNALEAPNWLRMLERADQIVIPTTTRWEHVESARLLLTALHSRDARSAALADQAIVIVTQADRDEKPPAAVIGQFEWLARAAVSIPYDPAMRADVLRLDSLAPTTREAWERAAEAVIAGEPAPRTAESDQPTPQRRVQHPAKPPAPPTPQPASSAPPFTPPSSPAVVEATPPPPRRAHQLTPVPGPSVSAALRQAAAAVSIDDPATDTSTSRFRLDRQRLIAIGLVLLLIILSFLAGGLLLGDRGPIPAPTSQAPVDPVQGWSAKQAWTSPSLPKGAPVLTVDDTIITTLEGEAGTLLTAMRADDGAILWTSLIEDPLTGPPQVIIREDGPAVVAATEHTLLLWPTLGSPGQAPTAQTWDFTEADLELAPGPSVPVLANEQTLTARVLVEDRLEKRSFPSHTRPLAVDDKGRLVTIADTGHWYAVAASSGTPKATLLEPPGWGALVSEVLGMAGDTLVVTWTRDEKTVHLVGYDVTDGMKTLWSTTVPGDPTAEDLHVAADGSWMIVDRTAVDLESGRDERLPADWETIAITADRAWSREQVATKSGRVSDLAVPVTDEGAVPVAVAEDDVAIVVAREGEQPPRIYGLRPESASAAA